MISGDFEETEVCDLGCKYAEWGQWESFTRYENDVKQTYTPDLDPTTGLPLDPATGKRTQIPPLHTYTCIRIGSMQVNIRSLYQNLVSSVDGLFQNSTDD